MMEWVFVLRGSIIVSVIASSLVGCAKSPAMDDAGPNDPFLAGPVTPPPAECEGDAYAEGDCVHPCVEESCDEGWCRVPQGCFIYGTPEGEPGHGISETQTPLTLTHDIVLQQHELTRGEWAAMGFPPTPVGPDGTGFVACTADACPVVSITWWEAVAAANRLSELHELQLCYELSGCTGEVGSGMVCEKVRALHANVYDCPGYRLPSLAEWEYSIRSGTRTAFYSGDIESEGGSMGYSYDPNLDPIGWYWWNSGPGTELVEGSECAGKTTHPVEQKAPNGWHLHDMSGNAMEWTWDRYGWGYGFEGVAQADPLDDGDQETHVYRGGAAAMPYLFLRSSANFIVPDNRASVGGGMRLVRTVSWPDGADTETVPDTDTETEGPGTDTVDHDPADCPLDSAWPCSCYIPPEQRGWFQACGDGSACAYVDPHYADWEPEYGVCAVECDDIEGDPTCDPTVFTGDPSCVLAYTYSTGGLPDGCVLACTDDVDCPSDQRCIIEDFYGPDATEGFCYPQP